MPTVSSRYPVRSGETLYMPFSAMTAGKSTKARIGLYVAKKTAVTLRPSVAKLPYAYKEDSVSMRSVRPRSGL